MCCCDITSCIARIKSYCSGDPTGLPLVVDTEDFAIYRQLKSRMEADGSKSVKYASTVCPEDGSVMIPECLGLARGKNNCVLFGVSQALLLRGSTACTRATGQIVNYSGQIVIILIHFRSYLQSYMQRDPRLRTRVVFVDGDISILPKIYLKKKYHSNDDSPELHGMKALLEQLEKMPEEMEKYTVATNLPLTFFSESHFSVYEEKGYYEQLCDISTEIAGGAQKEYGTVEQWYQLLMDLKKEHNFSAVLCQRFNSSTDLENKFNAFQDTDKYNVWLLWLALKIFGSKNNKYLSIVLNNSLSVNDFETHIYNDLLEIDFTETEFPRYYKERKELIAKFPEHGSYIISYCGKAGIRGKDEVYYLTDATEHEKYEFMVCINKYNYTEEELYRVTLMCFPQIFSYINRFTFDIVNTKLPDSEDSFRSILTDYFQNYKLQKISNRIEQNFLDKIKIFSETRPFNKLLSRSQVILSMETENATLFFFDALGVEFLSFIQEKAERYGLLCEIAVAHCELPSITSCNKEFIERFGSCNTIKQLDELKHHSQDYDYKNTPYPVHIFKELEIIDTELHKIQALLAQGRIEKAVIVSDHGASRLAVLYGKENNSISILDEKGEHSGRCCKCNRNPGIANAAYENGFAILADYERFKGGRAANLEVHGGATLEETLVPIITLTKRPETTEYYFVNSDIRYHINQAISLVLFCNVSMTAPRICIKGIFYEGKFEGDKKHARFTIPEIKRTGEYSAELYEGDKKLGKTLQFALKRGTKENDLF